MEDIPRKILFSLIHERGISITHDPGKFRNLLGDYLQGGYQRERNCLADSLSEGIPASLLANKDQLAYAMLSRQLSEKLIHNLGINADLANWTVDSWALALGVIQESDLHLNDFSVTILSNPPGARVSINGVFNGVTPVTLNNPLLGTYQIEISNEDYIQWRKSLVLSSRENLTLTANLIHQTEKPGTVIIETDPPNADIYLNSTQMGNTPHEIKNLSEGYYEIRLTRPGYKDIVIHKQIQTGKIIRITESFIPNPIISPPPVSSKKHTGNLVKWFVFLILLFIIAVISYTFLSIFSSSFTQPVDLPDKTGGFYQNPISLQQYTKNAGDWQFTLTSTNTYTLAGKVVGRHEYPATMPDGIIPLDLAVVNGDLVRKDILSYFTFTMGPGSLQYKYDIPTSTGLTEKYIDEHISLNRLVFISPALENEVKKVQVGSCLIIKGNLVDIHGDSPGPKYYLPSSTVRDDLYPTGAEVILVESFSPAKCGEETLN
jgi:hypothetical protein